MPSIRAFRKTMAILVIAVLSAVLVCLLPENEYQRWQLLDDTIHKNARWIYERSRFDPSPIDVAFLGSSRIGADVNAPRLGKALAAQGLPSNVVNFSMPETGRNANLAIAQQMFAAKRPKLIVLGVHEKPSRFGHSAFKYIGRRSDVVDPGYVGDLNYFSDLIYLPYRQMRLFAANVFPGGLGMAKAFDPTRYRGSTIDTTGSIALPDGTIKNGETAASEQELRRGVRKLEAGNHPPFLPWGLQDLEFGDERHYIREIVKLADACGAKVAFLYVPYYTGPDALKDVEQLKFYEQFGPVQNAGFVSRHGEWYADYAHMTREGAEVLTDWLVAPISALLKEGTSSG